MDLGEMGTDLSREGREQIFSSKPREKKFGTNEYFGT
jgi:hypothetical protein